MDEAQLPQGYSHFEEAGSTKLPEIPPSRYHQVPRNSWYSFYRPRKDERLNRPWNHRVVLDRESLEWETSAVSTRSLLIARISERFSRVAE